MVNKNRFDSMCSLDFTKFPFDTQICTIEIESFSSELFLSSVQIGEAPTGDLIGRNFIWNLVNKSASTDQDGAYMKAVFSFTVERRSTYHVQMIIVPSVILTVLQLAVFLLPYDAAERAGYAITVVLANQVSLTAVYGQIPVTSQPVYLVYYVSTIQSVGALICAYVMMTVRLADIKLLRSKSLARLDLSIAFLFFLLAIIINIVFFFFLLI